MIKGLKEILIFLSLSLKDFLAIVFLNLLYLVIGVVMTLVVFRIFPSFLGRPFLLLSLWIAVVLIHWLFKTGVMTKYQWLLKSRFSHYLSEGGSADIGSITGDFKHKDLSSTLIRENIRAVRNGLKSGLLGWMSGPVIVSIAISRISLGTPSKDHSNEATLVKQNIGIYYGWNLMVFLILLVPFVSISFLLTMGIHWPLKYLILFLGLLFAYLLHAALFEPIVSLVVHRKIFRLLRSAQ